MELSEGSPLHTALFYSPPISTPGTRPESPKSDYVDAVSSEVLTEDDEPTPHPEYEASSPQPASSPLTTHPVKPIRKSKRTIKLPTWRTPPDEPLSVYQCSLKKTTSSDKQYLSPERERPKLLLTISKQPKEDGTHSPRTSSYSPKSLSPRCSPNRKKRENRSLNLNLLSVRKKHLRQKLGRPAMASMSPESALSPKDNSDMSETASATTPTAEVAEPDGAGEDYEAAEPHPAGEDMPQLESFTRKSSSPHPQSRAEPPLGLPDETNQHKAHTTSVKRPGFTHSRLGPNPNRTKSLLDQDVTCYQLPLKAADPLREMKSPSGSSDDFPCDSAPVSKTAVLTVDPANGDDSGISTASACSPETSPLYLLSRDPEKTNPSASVTMEHRANPKTNGGSEGSVHSSETVHNKVKPVDVHIEPKDIKLRTMMNAIRNLPEPLLELEQPKTLRKTKKGRRKSKKGALQSNQVPYGNEHSQPDQVSGAKDPLFKDPPQRAKFKERPKCTNGLRAPSWTAMSPYRSPGWRPMSPYRSPMWRPMTPSFARPPVYIGMGKPDHRHCGAKLGCRYKGPNACRWEQKFQRKKQAGNSIIAKDTISASNEAVKHVQQVPTVKRKRGRPRKIKPPLDPAGDIPFVPPPPQVQKDSDVDSAGYSPASVSSDGRRHSSRDCKTKLCTYCSNCNHAATLQPQDWIVPNTERAKSLRQKASKLGRCLAQRSFEKLKDPPYVIKKCSVLLSDCGMLFNRKLPMRPTESITVMPVLRNNVQPTLVVSDNQDIVNITRTPPAMDSDTTGGPFDTSDARGDDSSRVTLVCQAEIHEAPPESPVPEGVEELPAIMDPEPSIEDLPVEPVEPIPDPQPPASPPTDTAIPDRPVTTGDESQHGPLHVKSTVEDPSTTETDKSVARETDKETDKSVTTETEQSVTSEADNTHSETLTMIQLPRRESSGSLEHCDPFSDDPKDSSGSFSHRNQILKCYTSMSPTRTNLARRKLMPKSKQKLVTHSDDMQSPSRLSCSSPGSVAERQSMSRHGDYSRLGEGSSGPQEESIIEGSQEGSATTNPSGEPHLPSQLQSLSLQALQAKFKLRQCSVVLEDFMDTMAVTDLNIGQEETEGEMLSDNESSTSSEAMSELPSDSCKKSLNERTHPWFDNFDSFVKECAENPSRKSEVETRPSTSTTQTQAGASLKKNIDWRANLAPIILPLRGSGLIKPQNPHEKYVFMQEDKDPVEIEEVEVVSVRGEETPPSATHCHYDVEVEGVEVCITETTHPPKPLEEGNKEDAVSDGSVELFGDDPWCTEEDTNCSPKPNEQETNEELLSPDTEPDIEKVIPLDNIEETATCIDQTKSKEDLPSDNTNDTLTDEDRVISDASSPKVSPNKTLVEANNNTKRMTRHALLVKAKRRNSNSKTPKKNGQSIWTSGYARKKWEKVQKVRSLRAKRLSSSSSITSALGSQSVSDDTDGRKPKSSPKPRLRQCQVALEDCMARTSRAVQRSPLTKKRKRSTSSSPKTYNSGQLPLNETASIGSAVPEVSDSEHQQVVDELQVENNNKDESISEILTALTATAPSPTRRSQRETYSRYRRTPDSSRENSKERTPSSTRGESIDPHPTSTKSKAKTKQPPTLAKNEKTIRTKPKGQLDQNTPELVREDLQDTTEEMNDSQNFPKPTVGTLACSKQPEAVKDNIKACAGTVLDTGDMNIQPDHCDIDKGKTPQPKDNQCQPTTPASEKLITKETVSSNILQEYDSKQNQRAVVRTPRTSKRRRKSPPNKEAKRLKNSPTVINLDDDSTDAYECDSDPYDCMEEGEDVVVAGSNSPMMFGPSSIPLSLKFGFMADTDRLMAIVEKDSQVGITRRPGRRVCVNRRKESHKENCDTDSGSSDTDENLSKRPAPTAQTVTEGVQQAEMSHQVTAECPVSSAEDREEDHRGNIPSQGHNPSPDSHAVSNELHETSEKGGKEKASIEMTPTVCSDDVSSQEEKSQEVEKSVEISSSKIGKEVDLAIKHGLKQCKVMLENCMIEIIPDATISMSPTHDDEPFTKFLPVKRKKKKTTKKFRSQQQQLRWKKHKERALQEKKSSDLIVKDDPTVQTESGETESVFVPVEDDGVRSGGEALEPTPEKTLAPVGPEEPTQCVTSLYSNVKNNQSIPATPLLVTSNVSAPSDTTLTADPPPQTDSPKTIDLSDQRNSQVPKPPTPITEPTDNVLRRTRSRESSPAKKTPLEKLKGSDEKTVPTSQTPLAVTSDSQTAPSEDIPPPRVSHPDRTSQPLPPKHGANEAASSVNKASRLPAQRHAPSARPLVVGTPGQAIRKHIKMVRDLSLSSGPEDFPPPRRKNLEPATKRRRLEFSGTQPDPDETPEGAEMAATLSSSRTYTTGLRYGLNPDPSYLIHLATGQTGSEGMRRPGRRVAIGRKSTASLASPNQAPTSSDSEGDDPPYRP